MSSTPTKIYIIQPKLNSVAELLILVDSYNNTLAEDGPGLEICNNASDADVIITAIRMRKRLERHVDWNIANQKAIVTSDWLLETVRNRRPAPYGKYAALKELQGADANSPYPDVGGDPVFTPPRNALSNELSMAQKPTMLVDTTSEKVKTNYTSRYACCRPSPLICPNQALLEELHVLERHRELEGLAINALSYARAISMLKAYPYPITPEIYRKEVKNLAHLGDKIQAKVKEFIKNGFIEESRTIRASAEYQALSTFTSIHGVGPSTANKLYELGLRTLEDMERYYDVRHDDGASLAEFGDAIYTPNGKLVSKPRSKIPDISVKVGLLLREEFSIPIPRDEVEEIHRVVMEELCQLQPGCISTIVGGYRRGKPFSNDVDIVLSHPDQRRGADIVKGLCQKLTTHLYKLGLITHVMRLSGFHAHNALHQGHSDALEKALTVFALPGKGDGKRIHRRLDLIFATPDAYWTAIVGWSGSKMFERDLRLWAKVEKSMKFDSGGLTRRHDSKAFVPRSEKEVFDILGLEWIDPIMRNADT